MIIENNARTVGSVDVRLWRGNSTKCKPLNGEVGLKIYEDLYADEVALML